MFMFFTHSMSTTTGVSATLDAVKRTFDQGEESSTMLETLRVLSPTNEVIEGIIQKMHTDHSDTTAFAGLLKQRIDASTREWIARYTPTPNTSAG
jgi:hypothetical protein